MVRKYMMNIKHESNLRCECLFCCSYVKC